MSRALRRELASLLFSTQARYLSASFFLYLLFADRMIPWSSGCIIEVALGGSMRNLMWEYSRTWWLEALSQTYSMWQFESLISLLSLVIIWWCISPVIQAFFEAYQSTDMSLHFVLLLQATGGFRFAYYQQLSVIRAIHIGDNKQCKSVFAFCRTCRLVTIKTIGPVRQRLVKQGSFIPIVNIIWWVPGKSGDKNSFLPGFQFIMGGGQLFAATDCLVHNPIPLSPPGNKWSIPLPIWMAKLLSKAERLKII